MTTIDGKLVGVIDGFDIEAKLVPDVDTSPGEFDCYSDGDIAAWKRGDWSYVGTIVTASRVGVELGSSSLWGSEYGSRPGAGWVSPLDGEGDEFINGYGPQLIREAIGEATAKLEELQG